MNLFLKSLFFSVLLSSASFHGYALKDEANQEEPRSGLQVRFSAQGQDERAIGSFKYLQLNLSYDDGKTLYSIGSFLDPTQGDARHSIAQEHGQSYSLLSERPFTLWLQYTNPVTNQVIYDLVIGQNGQSKVDIFQNGEVLDAVRIDILNVHTQSPQTSTTVPVKARKMTKYRPLASSPTEKVYKIVGNKLAPAGTFANDPEVLEAVKKAYKGPGMWERSGNPAFQREAVYVAASKASDKPELSEYQQEILRNYVLQASLKYDRVQNRCETQSLTPQEAQQVVSFMENQGIFEGYFREQAVTLLTTFIEKL